MKFVAKVIRIIHLLLGMLLHYTGKLRSQILCKYSADTKKCKQIAILSLLTLLIIHKF